MAVLAGVAPAASRRRTLRLLVPRRHLVSLSEKKEARLTRSSSQIYVSGPNKRAVLIGWLNYHSRFGDVRANRKIIIYVKL